MGKRGTKDQRSIGRREFLRLSAVIGASAGIAACGGHYYQVTDTASGKAYYTRDIDHDDGHARFVDKATGDIKRAMTTKYGVDF